MPPLSKPKEEDISNNIAGRKISVEENVESDGNDDFNILWITPPIAISLVVIIALIASKKKGKGEYKIIRCENCGSKLEYVEEYDDYYCWNCDEYLESGYGDIKEIPEPKIEELQKHKEIKPKEEVSEIQDKINILQAKEEKVKKKPAKGKKEPKVKEEEIDEDSLMRRYEEETGKNAVWRGKTTKGYLDWKKEKMG